MAKTGHCPYSGKESERGLSSTKTYLGGLRTRKSPPRGTPYYEDPRVRSRAAVERQEAKRMEGSCSR